MLNDAKRLCEVVRADRLSGGNCLGLYHVGCVIQRASYWVVVLPFDVKQKPKQNALKSQILAG